MLEVYYFGMIQSTRGIIQVRAVARQAVQQAFVQALPDFPTPSGGGAPNPRDSSVSTRNRSVPVSNQYALNSWRRVVATD